MGLYCHCLWRLQKIEEAAIIRQEQSAFIGAACCQRNSAARIQVWQTGSPEEWPERSPGTSCGLAACAAACAILQRTSVCFEETISWHAQNKGKVKGGGNY